MRPVGSLRRRLDALLQQVVLDRTAADVAAEWEAESAGAIRAADIADSPFLLAATSVEAAAAELLRRRDRWGITSWCTHAPSGPALADVAAVVRALEAERAHPRRRHRPPGATCPTTVARVVSLVPSLTEASRRPRPACWSAPRTGARTPPTSTSTRVRGTKNPDVDRVVALAPDLVVANAEENRDADLDALRAAGSPSG